MTMITRKFNSFVQQCLLALMLCAGGAAVAGPVFHVSVDTAAYSGLGLMDFTFLANAGATPAIAVIDNFAGAYGGEFERSPGAAGAIPGALELSNLHGGSYLTQIVKLGGLFSFELRFDGDFASTANIDASQFSVSLYQPDFAGFIGVQGSFAAFELLPMAGGQAGGVLASPPNALATVTEIPEPSQLLLALSALMLMGLARRRAA